MKRIVIALLALLISPSLLCANGLQNVRAEIERQGDELKFSVVNTSSVAVRINPPLFNSPDVAGHWLFLYDPEEKKLQTAWGTSFGTLNGGQGEPVFSELDPGEKVTSILTVKDMLGRFIVVPKCFHVVYVVRLKQRGNFVSSAPSNTIYMCK